MITSIITAFSLVLDIIGLFNWGGWKLIALGAFIVFAFLMYMQIARREIKIADYLNARANLRFGNGEIDGYPEPDPNVYRYSLAIKNCPKVKANDGSSNAEKVTAEITFMNIKCNKVYPTFRNIRWEGTPSPKEARERGEQPSKYWFKDIPATRTPFRLYFLTSKQNDGYLYIHNDKSYFGKGIRCKPEQRLTEKRYKAKVKILVSNADDYVVWICIVNKGRNNPPLIHIAKTIKRNYPLLPNEIG